MEIFRGGFASSALAVRRGLALEQAVGIYITDRRLIVTKEKADTHLGWQMNAGAALGSFVAKADTFLSRETRTVEVLDAGKKRLDVPLEQVASVNLKAPGNFFGGHIMFKLRSGQSLKVSIVDNTQAYSEEAYEAAEELVQLYLPGAGMPG